MDALLGELIPRTVSVIDVDNIRHNCKVYKDNFNDGVKFCAIVKANAYGHGSVQVSKYIEDIVDYFGVASPEEALELRKNSIHKPILVLGYVPKFLIKELTENNIDIPIHDVQSINEVLEIVEKENIKPKIQIKLDTGMSRIGFNKYDYIEKLEKIKDNPNLEIRGIFTHFSRADEEIQDFTNEQFNLFTEMVKNLENIGFKFPIRHISNSAAGLKKEYNLDMVRVGIGIYGIASSFVVREQEKEVAAKLKPCMALISPAYQIKKVPKGTMIGYGGTYVTQKEEWIATIPIGYSDGVLRYISNKDFKIEFENGEIGTVIGKVCMDQLMVRIDREIKPMTKAYIFSIDGKFPVEYFAEKSGTIAYEILSNIRRRVPRWYKKDGKIIEKISYI